MLSDRERLAEIMVSTIVKIANQQGFDTENNYFKLEMEWFKQCLEPVVNIGPEYIFHVLDQFWKRISNERFLLNKANKGLADSGLTPLGEAVLGSMMMAAKVYEDDAVWNEDYLQCLPPFFHNVKVTISKLSEIEKNHFQGLGTWTRILYENRWVNNMVGRKGMPDADLPSATLIDRVSQILSYMDPKDVFFMERKLHHVDSKMKLGFHKSFSNRLKIGKINPNKKSVDHPQSIFSFIKKSECIFKEPTVDKNTVKYLCNLMERMMLDLVHEHDLMPDSYLLKELEWFKPCLQVSPDRKTLHCILDQFEQRVGDTLSLHFAKTNEKGLSVHTGLTPIGEAVLGSIIIGSKIANGDTVSNKCLLKYLPPTFNVKTLEKIESIHLKGIENAGFLSTGSTNEKQKWKGTIKESMSARMEYLLDQQNGREVKKERVNTPAADDFSVRPSKKSIFAVTKKEVSVSATDSYTPKKKCS